jgi:hypothetical protein
VINFLAGIDRERLNIFFVRPREETEEEYKKNSVFISYGLQRLKPPAKILPNHFVLSATKIWGVVSEMEALIDAVKERFTDKVLYVHLGWPRSSWFERLFMGIMVYQMMRLPDKFPTVTFIVEYNPLMKQRPSLLSTGKLRKKKEA